ncbi:MAG TPA: ammonium transporter [Candidatus Binatia bacterium]|nr:ammonium transporter [Candidatus Binatia bacterium]
MSNHVLDPTPSARERWTLVARRARPLAIAAAALAALAARPTWAEEAAAAATVDTGDTAWVLTASALVLMMTLPGLALFYGGLVRAKNVLNVLMQCFISAGVVGVLWILVGYSLAFGTGNAFIGDFSKLGLAGVTLESVTANFASPPRNIPEYAFVMFQAMFAIITPALILGAIAERMKFSAWVAFITVWLLVVYCPVAHMVWGSEGWLFKSGAIDFAGGLVVHMSSGFSAIVAAIMLGKRRGFGKDPMPPHSLPLCLIGAGLLWTGWFGFNAGSALSASPLATLAFLNTGTAASMAVVAWAAIEWMHRGKPTALGGATAAVAGLVAITPACGNVAPAGAIAIGLGVAIISYAACTFLKPAVGYDDSLDVFGVHALGGAWGALASGIFAVTLGSGVETNAQQILVQLQGIAFTAVFAPIATVVILSLLKIPFGSLRASDEDEIEGLDLSQHSESAYGFAGGSLAPELGHSAHASVALAPVRDRQLA